MNHDIQERMETSMKCDANIEIEEDDSHDHSIAFAKNDEQQSMTKPNDSTFNFSIEQNGSENSLPAKIELLNFF
jgi:hypothetical protein